jgi:hypothetical protein
VHESSVTTLVDVVLSHREELTVPQSSPNAAATVLVLDRKGLSIVVRPPWVSLLEVSLACKEPRALHGLLGRVRDGDKGLSLIF